LVVAIKVMQINHSFLLRCLLIIQLQMMSCF